MNSLYEKNENFFLYLHYSKIHTGISNEVLKVYDNFSKEFFSNRELNLKRYEKLFMNAEIYLETILEKINKLNFDKNSIILILSDHGIGLGEKFGERAYGSSHWNIDMMSKWKFIKRTISFSMDLKRKLPK